MPTLRKSEFTALSLSVVAICFSTGVIGRMIPEHFPNLLSPLTTEFAWSRGTVASIFSLCAVTTGLSGPIAGFLFDRLGPARLYPMGFFLSGMGLILASQATDIWMLYAGLGLFVGFNAACSGNVTNSALVSRWFHAKLPLALSLVFSALGAGSFIGLSLSQLLISQFGWRTAEMLMGGAILALVPLLLVLPWKKLVRGIIATPSDRLSDDKDGPADLTLGRAVRGPSFWGFAAVFFLTANGMYAIIFQSVTYLIENGMQPVEGSFYVGLTGLFIPVGMISCGYLLTRYNAILVTLGSFVMTFIAMLSLWLFQEPDRYWAVFGFVLFFGLTMGTRGPIVGSLAARVFRGKNFGLIYGFIYVGGGMGTASGSFLSGWIYDVTHSYDAVFLFAMTCLVLGAFPFILIPAIRKLG